MSLLREIQAAAIDDQTSVSTLLLKCKLLAARINHEEFAAWVDLELDGYPEGAPLPVYRFQGRGRATGTFSGFGGETLQNVSLSMGPIDEEHRDRLFNIDLRQPAAVLESLAAGDNPVIPWTGDWIGRYGAVSTFVSGMALIDAKTIVPKGAIVAALSAIRSRALAAAIEIERAAPGAGEDLAGEDPLPREVHAAVTQNIYGSTVAIGSGPAIAVQGAIGELIAGDVTNVSITAVLARLEREIEKLAVPEEERTRLRRWIGAARGALTDTSSSVAAKLLAELLTKGIPS